MNFYSKIGQATLVVVTLIIIASIAVYYANFQAKKQIELRYGSVNQQLHTQLDNLIEESKQSLLLIAIASSQYSELKQGLIKQTPETLKLKELSDTIAEGSNLKGLWFQVITANGDSLSRSWTKKRGDSLLKARLDVVQMINNPDVRTYVSTGKFNVAIKVMVPVFFEEKFIGIFEVITNFDSIADTLKEQTINPVFLIDKKYKKQLSKANPLRFLNDYYVSNANVLADDVAYLKNSGFEKLFNNEQSYLIDHKNNQFVSYYKLPDIKGKKMGHFFLLQPLDDIDIDDIQLAKQELLFSIAILIIILLLILLTISKMAFNNKVVLLNKELEKVISLKTKNLDHLAHHDPLTNLPNRTLFAQRLDSAIQQSKDSNNKTALLFIDLDRFKDINDTLGHSIGDLVLIETAQRLGQLVKDGDTLSRFGGDEFVFIVAHIKTMADAEQVAIKVLDIMRPAMQHGDTEFYVTPSIGISIFPDDASNIEHLISHADSALYKAKNEGRNNYQLYNKEMTTEAKRRSTLENDLHRAIDNENFCLYYQPQYNCVTDEIIGLEALLRWHKNEELVLPCSFIQVAEETGQIVELGKLVIRLALKQLVQWKKDGVFKGKLSINLSVKQIQGQDFIRCIKEYIETIKFDPQDVQFEITESYLMSHPKVAIETLEQLKRLNFSISIDDFGTGYSSLSYLKDLPVDELKIDKSFIKNIHNSKKDLAIVQTIISLAKGMKLEVIAEGIETKEQQDVLLAESCERMQGFLYSKPLSVQDTTALLLKQ